MGVGLRKAQGGHGDGTGMVRGWHEHGDGLTWGGMGKGVGMRMAPGWGWHGHGDKAQVSAGSWHGRHKPGDTLGWALAPRPPTPSLPVGEELLEEGRLAALGQDFHLPGQGQGGDGDIAHATPLGHPWPPAPTCVRGE